MKADRCDIYTDVDGVYTTDPRIVPAARKLKPVTYEEMLELASVGAKVLQTRSVGLAMKEKVRVQVLSSFTGDDAPDGRYDARHDDRGRRGDRRYGTPADHRDRARQERGEDHADQRATRPGTVAAIFAPLAAANINVDMIIQNIAHQRRGVPVPPT